eukprot:s9_g45.t1
MLFYMFHAVTLFDTVTVDIGSGRFRTWHFSAWWLTEMDDFWSHKKAKDRFLCACCTHFHTGQSQRKDGPALSPPLLLQQSASVQLCLCIPFKKENTAKHRGPHISRREKEPLISAIGDSEDSKEYKRWKTWCCNKLLTLDKLPEASRGAYVYTLLSGKALEAVEHLEPSAYQKAGGDLVLWELLDQRFPQKEQIDELGEILGEVFTLKVKDGETMKMWAARSQELFEKCARKTGVKFPDEARGWLMLHRAGLSEEQKAVVIARAGGDLNREKISTALRSCYPDFVARRKGAAVVDEVFPVEDHDDFPPLDSEFQDVQDFVADHLGQDSLDDGEDFPEGDVAEVLAATWKEKRQELSRLQKSRQFGKAREVRRAFRVEVEELKAKTTCHRCGKRGHWAKECPLPKGSGKSKGGSAPTSASATGAALVETADDDAPEFVAAVVSVSSMVQQLRERLCDKPSKAVESGIALVSCPGFGVLDSGCGRTIIGESTLRDFEKLWKQNGDVIPAHVHEVHQFKYGNGEVETSQSVVPMPVYLAGRKGVIRASIVRGAAPLLISRTALKKLGASLDFQHDRLRLFNREVPLQVNQAGQYVVNLMKACEDVDEVGSPFAEVMTIAPHAGSPPDHVTNEDVIDSRSADPDESQSSGADASCCASITDCPAGQRVLQKNTIQPLVIPDQHVISEFHFHGKADCLAPARNDVVMPTWKPTKCQARRLLQQASVSHEVCSAECQWGRGDVKVMEVFSPPRFAPEVQSRGFEAKSYDLKTGYDLSTARDRRKVEEDLLHHRPELLVLCPPCTHEGGWFHLNSTKLERREYLQLRARSRSFIRWCCKLFRMQVNLGGRAIFEHPTGARTWTYPEMQTLCKRFTTVKLHLCRYGLQLPESNQLIRKSTRLLASHQDMESLGLLCPGKQDPLHMQHDTIQGSAPGVPSVSAFAGAYPTPFVRAVLETVPMFRNQPAFCVTEDSVSHACWDEVCAVSKPSSADLLPVIKKLHNNLGHPPNSDLVRILRHGQASSEAIEAARSYDCQFCKSQTKPGIPLPAQPNRVHEFNAQVGLDVKNLRGWRPNQKVKALNLVDTASSFQRMIPFFQNETSELLQELFSEHWVAWAGPPKELVLDPAQTNMGDPMVTPCELRGIHIRPIAAGAHWQLGKTESHGGWFAHVLDKLIDEHQPKNKEEWLSCVRHAHVKNQMIQVHGFSPHQFVFGKGVHIPDDLLGEPVSVVPATASLTDSALAKSQAMRVTARVALAKLQDDRALRVALLARPRRSFEFKPGMAVAYWRDQKWVNGQLQLGGRWHGPAVVIGTVGRNVIVIHRKQLLRCAPEQLRPSTSEEQQLLHLPDAELLGIKNLVETGSLESKNYVDLVPQSYPPMPDVDPAQLESDAQQPDSIPVSGHASLPEPAINSESPAAEPEIAIDKTAQDPSGDMSVDAPNEATVSADATPADVSSGSHVSDQPTSYGPIRRRVHGKDGPLSLYRPPAMRQDDFVDVMKEVVPQLIEQAVMSEERSASSKRPHADETSPEVSEPASSRAHVSEVLSVQDCTELLDLACHGPSEVLMAEYLKKKLDKELRHSNNPPDLQQKVDDGKLAEWQTLLSKPNALKIHYGKAAEHIRRTHADRFMGSRFVLTRKPVEEGHEIDPHDFSTFTVKGRWCLQGHLDPDLQAKAEEGLLKSPTLSQLGRMTLMQVLASHKWLLQLGDIKGAFLEAGPLEERFRPLYAHQPPGGIPGVPSDAVIEVLGNVYGQNDAPAAWFREFNSVV